MDKGSNEGDKCNIARKITKLEMCWLLRPKNRQHVQNTMVERRLFYKSTKRRKQRQRDEIVKSRCMRLFDTEQTAESLREFYASRYDDFVCSCRFPQY